MSKDIGVVIPALEKNRYSPLGDLVKFGDSTLLEWKIVQLLKVMKKEDISERDFIIRQIPQLSMEGSKRKLFLKPHNFKSSQLEVDELNKGKNKIKIEFKLDKGCYATTLIKYLMSS